LVYAPQESFCDLEYLADRQRVLWQEIATKFTPLAHAVVSVSDELAQVEKLENGARNVRVIHNMPDTSTEVSSIDIKSALGISALEKLAVVVGNVVSNRGVEIAIEGIARNPDWKLAVVGGGSDEYIAKLRNFAQSIGVAKRVFFTGAIPRTQLTAYLETADLNLIPALPTVGRNHELSMPNKLFDGLSAGLPVLAVSGMALAAFVEREKLGATYTGDDYDELAKKLDEAQNFGVAARTRRHEFVWLANDEIVGETIDVAIAQHAKDSEH
jgi:glycosyltransferase involved in cell wall biosynthesis